MAYGYFKDLPRRTVADKVLRGGAFKIAKNPKYGEYQRGLASMVYKPFDNKSALLARFETLQQDALATQDKSVSGSAITREIMPNQQLAEELQRPIIRKSEKRKVHSSLKNNIWGC